MRRLLLLRHAKSSWDNPRLADFDRPLNPRGRRDAPRMGIAMRAWGYVPDLVLCSTARRTRDTWALIGPRLAADVPVTYLDRLYEADAETLLCAVRNAPPGAGTVLLIGHNPGIEILTRRLAGPGSDPAGLRQVNAKYPTCALAVLGLENGDWSGLRDRGAVLRQFVRPRELRISGAEDDQSVVQKRSA